MIVVCLARGISLYVIAYTMISPSLLQSTLYLKVENARALMYLFGCNISCVNGSYLRPIYIRCVLVWYMLADSTNSSPILITLTLRTNRDLSIYLSICMSTADHLDASLPLRGFVQDL